MDVERGLLSRILFDKDINSCADNGVTAEFFLDPSSRAVFETLIKHRAQYGNVPSVAVMKMDFPTYKFIKPDESMDFYLDRIRDQHKLALLEKGLQEGVDAFDQKNSEGTVSALSRTLSAIATDIPNTYDVDISETGIERLEKYLALKNLPDGLRGIPTGFHTLDRATQGMQKGQLLTLVGPPKSGKTTLMILCAMAAWVSGVRPLVFTFEMSNDEMTERVDAIKAGISHSRLRNGSLKKSEWQKLERTLHSMDSMPSFFFSSDMMSATTLTGISAKIDSLKPDIVFVDGIYMMDDEEGESKGSPQALTNLTRGFKRMAKTQDLPVVESTQVLEWKMSKKHGITTNSIGYSSSFAQDSDTVIGVENTDDSDIRKVKVVAARNCPPLETFIQWDWDTGAFQELESDPLITEEKGGWNGSPEDTAY